MKSLQKNFDSIVVSEIRSWSWLDWSCVFCILLSVTALFLPVLYDVPIKLSQSFGISGILSSVSGTCWIATGVLLTDKQKSALLRFTIDNGVGYIGVNPTKKDIVEILHNASRKILLGVACVTVGAAFQITSLLV